MSLKNKRSRKIRPKPDPRPKIWLPLKEAKVSFAKILVEVKRIRHGWGCGRRSSLAKQEEGMSYFTVSEQAPHLGFS